MCVVSMVTDHYQRKWGEPWQPFVPMFPVYPVVPDIQPYIKPSRMITQAEWDEYQELKRKAEEYDRRTGQPDCEKPELIDWETKMVAYLQGETNA